MSGKGGPAPKAVGIVFTDQELHDLSDAIYEASKAYETAASMMHYTLTSRQRTKEADRRWRLFQLRGKINRAVK